MGNTTGKVAAAVESEGLEGILPVSAEEVATAVKSEEEIHPVSADVAGDAPKSSEAVSDQTSPAAGEKIHDKAHRNDGQDSWTKWKANAAVMHNTPMNEPRRLIVDTPEEASSIGVSWAGGFGRSVAALIDGSSAKQLHGIHLMKNGIKDADKIDVEWDELNEAAAVGNVDAKSMLKSFTKKSQASRMATPLTVAISGSWGVGKSTTKKVILDTLANAVKRSDKNLSQVDRKKLADWKKKKKKPRFLQPGWLGRATATAGHCVFVVQTERMGLQRIEQRVGLDTAGTVQSNRGRVRCVRAAHWLG